MCRNIRCDIFFMFMGFMESDLNRTKVARIGKAIFTSDGARESKPVSNLQPLIGRQRLVASCIFQKKRDLLPADDVCWFISWLLLLGVLVAQDHADSCETAALMEGAGRPCAGRPGGLAAPLSGGRSSRVFGVIFCQFFLQISLCRPATGRPGPGRPAAGRPEYIHVNFEHENIFL